jgi:hypothetical protein
MDHMTPETAEHIRNLLPADAIICIGCIALAWGVLLIALI